MNNIEDHIHGLVNQIYYKGIKPLIIEEGNYAYISDPVLGLKRNRVVAEVVKAMIRLKLESDKKIIDKFCNFLLKNQNTDGSWNELHPNYNQPSALVSSIVGEALLLAYKEFGEKKFEEPIIKAKNYVLSQYKSDGYFLKSKHYTADHLNVDAVCGAFLALYGNFFNDEFCINISKQTARHICQYQFSNGSFPYTINQGNYDCIHNIPCIHYQGVTMYYLIKINNIIGEEYIRKCLLRAGDWLLSVQRDNGKFEWSHSGLMFAYYLTGAYGFCFSSFVSISQWEKKYMVNGLKCLDVLYNNSKDLVFRWETDAWKTFPFSIYITIKTSKIGNFPIKQKLFRFGYGLYRQMARRRFSDHIDDTLFNELTKIFRIKPSTIESFSNYRDLFMSSEVLDCLSSING